MLPDEVKDKLRELKPEFEHYVKKVRGYLCLLSGIEAVIIWQEFMEYRKENDNSNYN